MLKIYRCALAAAVFGLSGSSATAGELKLTLTNGLVSVVADQVPVSRILSEWARVGQTKIVNGERLMTLVSLELVDVPEKKALEIVLRSASGYLAAQRAVPIAGTSAFDRIMILPFSQAPAQSVMPVAQTVPQPFVNRPVMATPDVDDASQVMPPAVFPQQPVNTPQTLSAPGMLPQPVTPNGQPQMTSPRPGFLPPPGPIKPPGGGATDR